MSGPKDPMRKLASELDFIRGGLGAVRQDWEAFDNSSKKLGAHAARALTSLRERLTIIAQCAEDAAVAFGELATADEARTEQTPHAIREESK